MGIRHSVSTVGTKNGSSHFNIVPIQDTVFNILTKTGCSSREHAISTAECHEVSRKFQNAKASEHQAQPQMDVAASSHKAIGVQTPSVSDCTNIAFSDDLLNCLGLSEKLRSIWSTPSNQKLGRTVISRLLVACAADFHVLFGCMSMNVSSKVILNSLAGESPSHVDWQFNMHSFHSLEAAKVSHLYSVLAKIGNGMLPLETLFEPLLDLCSLGNVVIIHRSLHILHLFLKHLLTLERNSWRRDNVMVEGDCFRSNDEEFYGNESIKTEGLFCANRGETSHAGHLPFDIRSDAGNKRARLNPGCAVLVSCIDWVSLFDLMCQVAVRSTEKNVKFEAVSIMNIIVLRSNAHLERERFGQARVFESISQLLKKEASLHVRKKALHLLHLLLNCPKLLVTFCSGCNKADSASAANDDEPNSKRFTIILEGLAECLAGCGNGVQGLELQRNAIVLLAFLASFGKSGFDILVSHKLPQESNFLMLILQVIVSEMETEPAACTESTEILKARTLLVREALILLNRLVSHPSYSGTVLQLLTNSRDMATLTIDIANSLTWKGQRLKQSGSLARHMKDTDIFDLARGFKKRVFSYFGGTIS